ncbi:MAG TPA: OmpH family outer membrane protein [Armatimonadota bacterium]|jgi:Skp family chaperone for outer membrane proteins
MSQKAYLVGTAVFALLGFASWSRLLAEGETPAVSPPAPGAVAVADVQKIAREYNQMKAGEQELQTMQTAIAKEMDSKDQGRFLDDQERVTLATLQKVAQPTADQQKQLRDLQDKNAARAARLRTLQQTPSRSTQETADYDQLNKQSQAMDEDLRKMDEDGRKRMDAKLTEINDRLTATVLAAIATVAKEKSLAVVFDKSAVLYGWNEITADVLKKVNTGVTAPAAASTTAPPAKPAG